MTARTPDTENGAGCLILIALGMVTISACSMWGAQALFVIGGLILFWMIFL